MKYRIKRIPAKENSRLTKGVKLRFAGKDKLSKIHSLPEPIEGVSFSEEDLKGLRKRKKIRLHLAKYIKIFFVGLWSELRALTKKTARLFRRVFLFISKVIHRWIENKKAKRIDSLPMLSGALTACILVCSITWGYMLLVLFAPYARSYDTITIPDFQGMLVTDIKEGGEHINLVIQYENNPEIADGRVISQLPSAGVTRKIYSSDDYCDVVLTVSRKEIRRVPEGLEGVSLRDASLALLNGELRFTVNEEYSVSSPKGTVIRVYPEGGAPIGENDSISLTVSLGEREILATVPDLVGLSEGEAIRRIGISELTVGKVTYVRSSESIGTVVSQSLRAHASVSRGTVLSLSVSGGDSFEQKAVPDLYGMSVEEAVEALRELGLTAETLYSVSSAAPSGTVIRQDPLPLAPITTALTSVKLIISQ